MARHSRPVATPAAHSGKGHARIQRPRRSDAGAVQFIGRHGAARFVRGNDAAPPPRAPHRLVEALQDGAAAIPPEPDVPVVEVVIQSVGTGGFRQ